MEFTVLLLRLLVIGISPEPSEPDSQTKSLGIMTINLQHERKVENFKKLTDGIRDDFEDVPEFFVFQEVMFDNKKEESTASIRHFAEQMGYYYRATSRPTDNEGLGIASRYPFSYYAHKRYKKQSLIPPFYKRIALMGEFEVPGQGLVRVVNIHLTNWGWENGDRRKQMRETLEWMAERQREVVADVIVLGGDFNGETSDSEFRDLLKDEEIMDGVVLSNFNSSQGTHSGGARIDNLLVWSRLTKVTPESEAIVDYGISDHSHVAHRYEMNPKSYFAHSSNLALPGGCLLPTLNLSGFFEQNFEMK